MKPTPEQIKEVQHRIHVMLNWRDGKVIQFKTRYKNDADWILTATPNWNWELNNYRTKPEPPTVWAADLDTEFPTYYSGKNRPPFTDSVWKKYTLHEVLP